DNGVDVEYFQPQNGQVDPNTLVFTGSMDGRPNQDAVEYFVTDVLPILRSARPEMKFVAVGRKPPAHIVELGKRDGVTITGTVDDVRPYIAKAALYVVPLRVGGGSRLKILEAMAMRKPVISTGVGAEGLEVTEGENIILTSGAEKLAESILLKLDDPEGCARLAEAGHKLVHERYRWQTLGDKLHAYIQELVNGD
ncbi:glycosyltransferase, partial [candidate division GN15 bacterium]|nr:glycosyltransferase [candidate division GN15 bacterium]